MGFSMKHFTHDEVLVLDLHPHWWRFVKPVVVIIATLAALANTHRIPNNFLRDLALIIAQVLTALAVLNLALQTLKWYRTHFVLTSQRVIFQSGVIGRTRIDIALNKINLVNFHQSVFERLINAGDIIIESGAEDGVETIIDVRDPQNVQAYIHEWMRRNIDDVNN
ncbi:MAG: PH domain-containing protein [Actinomycetota bacterium]